MISRNLQIEIKTNLTIIPRKFLFHKMSKTLKEDTLEHLPTELLAAPQPPVALVGLDASGDHNPIWKAMGEGGGVTRQLKWILVKVIFKSHNFGN